MVSASQAMLQRLLGVVFVLRQGQDVDADRVRDADARLQDGGELLVLGAAQEGEVAHAVGEDVEPSPAVVETAVIDDGAGAGDVLVGRHGDVDGVDAGLVEERLVPGDERRRLPELAVGGARLVLFAGPRVGRVAVEGEDRQPVAQEGDAAPLAPAALLLRQFHRDVEHDGDRLALADGPRQRHDEGGVGVALVAERHIDGGRAGSVSDRMAPAAHGRRRRIDKSDFMDLTSRFRFAQFVAWG